MITIDPVMEATNVLPKVSGYLEPREIDYTSGYVEYSHNLIKTKQWQDPKEFYEYNCKSDAGIVGSICEWVAIYLVRKYGFKKEGTTIRYCSAHPDAKQHEYSGQDFLLNHSEWRNTYGANCKSAHISESELRFSRYHMPALLKYKPYKVHRFMFLDRFNMKMVIIRNEDFQELANAGHFTQRADDYWVCPMDKVLQYVNTELLSDN